MSVVALVTWITAAGFGLYLLSIWLIEYDKDFQTATATRLPIPVLFTHILMAVGGLLLWSGYLIWDDDRLVLYSLIALLLAASLGITMAIRWLSVYRAKRQAMQAVPAYAGAAVGGGSKGAGVPMLDPGPPERNFPLPVVIAHGLFAVLTLTLVALTAVGVGGS